MSVMVPCSGGPFARITRVFPAYDDTWTQHVAAERDLKRRRRYVRKGPGWAEQDQTLSDGTPYVERIEWLPECDCQPSPAPSGSSSTS